MDERKVFGSYYGYSLSRRKKAKSILFELKKYAGLKSDSNLNVISVGCEYGFIEYNLAKWTNWEITANEIVAENITRYKEFGRYFKQETGDSTKLPYKDNSFDLAISNHMIEHIQRYKDVIKELYRVLKVGGVLYLATPNLYRKIVGPKISFRRKTGLKDKERIEKHMGFSADELEKMLNGFSRVINLNKEHLMNRSKTLAVIPKSVLRRYAQTNVFICIK